MGEEIKDLKKPNLRYIMIYLKNKNCVEGYTVKELSKILGLHKENLRKYLHELEDKGLINIIRSKYEMKIVV